MKEQFVTIEIAKRLRELGFNEECFTYWEDKYTGIEGIPLWQQAIKFINDKLHNKFGNQYKISFDGNVNSKIKIDIWNALELIK